MLAQKFSQAEIAKRLGRDRATISREIKRNYWHDNEFPDADGYWAMTANDMARDRRRRTGKLFQREDLRTAVIGKLEAGWSPEQIAGRLKIEPKAKARVCHETIYRYVYSPEGQRQQLARLLHLRFALSENTFDYLQATKAYLEHWGKPLAFYSDKHGVFRTTHASEMDRTSGLTQFGRALYELNIDIICANTPQAKGRVERAKRTHQDRQVKELRLRGINTL